MRTTIATLLMALIASACGSEPAGGGPDAGGPERDLSGTWELTSGTSTQGEIRIDANYRITLLFEEGSVSGTSACNYYGGNIAIDGDSFAVDGLGGTAMGCEPDVMQTEARYLDALMAADTMEQSSDALTLTGSDVELIFERQPPVPTAELEDTVWNLDGLIEGRGPGGVVSSAEPATLQLRSDGSLVGTTGCRDLTGKWQARGDEIATPELAAEGSCPARLQAQDGHVVEVIGDAFMVEIEGETLTIFSTRGDQGLIYKASRS